MKVEEWLGKENQLGIDIWKGKYKFGEESFEDWITRISGGNEKIGELIRQKKFLFGGRILANRGLNQRGIKITLSNCYVVEPPQDNLESIFECAKKLARTYSYGGGCGVDVSQLSPMGARINNAAKETSGALSFMELYDLTTSLIGQNGRRGALMISLDCSHPDIEEFIRLKTDLGKATKANLSIRLNGEFMEAVRNRQPYLLTFTREATGETIERSVDAKELFHKIAKANWDYAEPGALFWDRIESWNLLSEVEDFQYAGVNPCAEEPLPAGGSCLLGSMNLASFVKDPFTNQASFDYEDFGKSVEVCVEGLNEVLEEGLNLHPLQEQIEQVTKWRQIGLGLMGIADMLIQMGITYGSKESIELSEQISFFMMDRAIAASAKLAQQLGAFPMCETEQIMKSPFFLQNTTEETRKLVEEFGLRNSQLLTIAPTGTLSTMLGISGGIEPIYANYYERTTQSLHGRDVTYRVYTKIVEEYMKLHNLSEVDELPDYFVTAMELDYHSRLKMQATWQKHIDASISSTVNVPNEFSVEQVGELYFEAYELGLKGVTLFRDGCKRTGILNVKPQKKAYPAAGEGLARGEIVQVSDEVIGAKRKLTTGCGTLHCIALFDPKTGALLETYLSKGSTGGCNNFMIGLSRMISICARAGVDLRTIVDQLDSTGVCPSYAVRQATKHDTSKGACCPMAVGNALLEMYEEVKAGITSGNQMDQESTTFSTRNVSTQPQSEKKESDRCPECGEQLVFEGGCNICKSCGWSKCL
ncbi:MAG: adenosylcobalamin-dependent ribonucleoside-diphosphate reductase [Lachnospiraceae bacterium]|nr:adenosylcobalamin-dependent ribonucleoside-diphosphate reductase [Lachnospiraceae bacterium]